MLSSFNSRRGAEAPLGAACTSNANGRLLLRNGFEAVPFGVPHAFKQVERLKGVLKMLWTIVVVLLVLWALGMVSAFTMGGLIHALLVLAVIVLLLQVLRGGRIA